MSAEARRTLKLLKKDIRTEDSLKILTFYLRNDSEHSIRINSAELVFDADAPVTEADVSPANKPVHRGFLVCKLLFNRKSESMKLIPQKDINLDLLLQRNLTEDESAAIISRKLGYIRFAGVFRESEVNFHKDA
jgi:hypothetical protein